MNITQKLEIFRKIYCLGDRDIKKIFDSEENYEEYWKFKYEDCRKTYGDYGNFHFLFQLDNDNATTFLNHVGFKDIENSVKFIKGNL
jgi:hypothetical protein